MITESCIILKRNEYNDLLKENERLLRITKNLEKVIKIKINHQIRNDYNVVNVDTYNIVLSDGIVKQIIRIIDDIKKRSLDILSISISDYDKRFRNMLDSEKDIAFENGFKAGRTREEQNYIKYIRSISYLKQLIIKYTINRRYPKIK